ncbi:MAG: 50S ribosomal protein L1 [Candidatus Aminicenantes bacterium]|nr:50S ribosomal protein L1 [Candidatus Aminicenantes bacterium]
MSGRGKNYKENRNTVEDKSYKIEEAIDLLKGFKTSKFAESVDIAIRLNVDPKYPEQMIRGTIVLPHGTGKKKSVLVIADGEKQKEAEEAGADYYGGEEMAEKIQKENWSDFDVLVATPDMMGKIGRLGKVLGPKGLMPSPKAGTVTFNIKEAVAEIKKGRIEYKVDKTGIINTGLGKISFESVQLIENTNELLTAVVKARPASLKGKYIESIFLSSTMSPSIKLDILQFEKN